jgi:protein-S-isoprenylcysteine O-methyltransferase Ste14
VIRAYTVIVAAYLFGGTSLLLYGLFLLAGPLYVVNLGLSSSASLGLDMALCMLFFLQHSVMVRKSFQRRLGLLIPDHYHAAIYAITSGAVLLLLLLFWQPTDSMIASAAGALRWLLRGLFMAAALGMLWGTIALGSFDGFGIRPIKLKMRGKTLREMPLAIRGPYRWVRHPLYAFILVMLWSYPDLTADRLLLNVSWTIWIFIGSALEERDLVATFGEPYREYQRQVPMLLPLKLPRWGDN